MAPFPFRGPELCGGCRFRIWMGRRLALRRVWMPSTVLGSWARSLFSEEGGKEL